MGWEGSLSHWTMRERAGGREGNGLIYSFIYLLMMFHSISNSNISGSRIMDDAIKVLSKLLTCNLLKIIKSCKLIVSHFKNEQVL